MPLEIPTWIGTCIGTLAEHWKAISAAAALATGDGASVITRPRLRLRILVGSPFDSTVYHDETRGDKLALMTAFHGYVENRGLALAKQVRVRAFKITRDGKELPWIGSSLKWADTHEPAGEKQFEGRDIRRGPRNRQAFDICRTDNYDQRLYILCATAEGTVTTNAFAQSGTYEIYIGADADGMFSVPAELRVVVKYVFESGIQLVSATPLRVIGII